ncbi:phage recombination protein Bet [Variovorax sp. YR634]|uniref:phage recombination protein Bet n=1 Tax=Variovorax sp. YR634 TaxID=1884385 RepID=UPI0008998726|nr:phage recombination protein Bet [Variovorax sp. YR634]SDX14762.1 phage recombination protein Bet [Variovorax sp. YR634]
MSNVLAINQQPGSALALTEGELIEVLQSSLYPGASIPSIKMVIGYCKAAGLDPMKKPVHIVPMWDSKAGQMRDVVMPGVGLYRTDAARTGNFAGQSEPEFGPMVTEKLGGVEVTYPEWAKVVVKKSMAGGFIAEFTAIEYWIENYAVKGGKEKSVAPNSMWMKRPRGQIAKCAAAQALRLAFPEGGAQPTAEEMEGKSINDFQGTTIDADTGEVTNGKGAEKKPTLPTQGDEEFAKNMVIWTKVIKSGKKDVDGVLATVATVATLTEAQIDAIKKIPAELAKAAAPAGPTFAQVADALAKAQDEDALNVAADLINAITDEQQRTELSAKYDARRAELNAE